MNTSTGLRVAGKWLAATVCAFVFMTTLIAGSASLHKMLHSDHGSPSHACLVSLLDHSQTVASAGTAEPVPPTAEFALPFAPPAELYAAECLSPPAARGPPALL